MPGAAEAGEQHGTRQCGCRAREERRPEPPADEEWTRARRREIEASPERAEHGELGALARDRRETGTARLAEERDALRIVAHGGQWTREQRVAVERAHHVEPTGLTGRHVTGDAHEAIRPDGLDLEHPRGGHAVILRSAPRADPAAPSARPPWRDRSPAPRPTLRRWS